VSASITAVMMAKAVKERLVIIIVLAQECTIYNQLIILKISELDHLPLVKIRTKIFDIITSHCKGGWADGACKCFVRILLQ
jgi:hypothetical protein